MRVTWLLTILNLVVFIVETRLGDGLEAFLLLWGLVAADFTELRDAGPNGDPAVMVTLVSSLFLHTGWLHLGVNLLYLVVFGGSVERRLGAGRFLALYLLAGLTGGLVHVLVRPDSIEPALGASGAIAGVIAAHLALYPGATLATLVPVLFFSSAADLPTVILLVLWVVAQVLSGLSSMTSSGLVAWWAHVGGFLTGLVLGSAMRPRRMRLR
jgi:membrane associated rhomboid family serine protease